MSENSLHREYRAKYKLIELDIYVDKRVICKKTQIEENGKVTNSPFKIDVKNN